VTRPVVIPEPPAERLARRATAVGVGFLVLMPAWQLGLRLTTLAWRPPVAPMIAMAAAIAVSVAAMLAVGRRLHRAGTGTHHSGDGVHPGKPLA
jgi:hypothetical protein